MANTTTEEAIKRLRDLPRPPSPLLLAREHHRSRATKRLRRPRSPHHNAYLSLDEQRTIALPVGVRLKPRALALFYHLHELQGQQNKRTFTVKSAADLIALTGMSDKTIAAARGELIKAGLITASDTRGRDGVAWTYELRNPSTGGPIPKRVQVDFATVSDRSVLKYYRRLKLDVQHETMDCPKCHHAGALIRLEHGADKHGTWKCANRRCNEHGGFIEAFMWARGVTRDMAKGRAVLLLNEVMDEGKPQQPSPPSTYKLPARLKAALLPQEPSDPDEVVIP